MKPLNPETEHALGHNAAGAALQGAMGPAEMEALNHFGRMTSENPMDVSVLFGVIVGFLVSRGVTPEEIGDAATALARTMLARV